MTLEDQITALLAEAEPLRGFSENDPESVRLCELVDRINVLRAQQSRLSAPEPQAEEARRKLMEAEAREAAMYPEATKRRGRPPKAKQEGADA